MRLEICQQIISTHARQVLIILQFIELNVFLNFPETSPCTRGCASRRRFGRFSAGRLGCNLGRVMDLSGGGMRVRCSRRSSGIVEVQLWTVKCRTTVQAKIVWARRIGFRNYELGLEFRDLTPESREDLNMFAAYLAAG